MEENCHKQCLYDNCKNKRKDTKPFCQYHFDYLINKIVHQQYQQGGNLIGALGKLTQKGMIALDKVDTITSRAQSQASQITSELKSISPPAAFDSNYSSNALISSGPLNGANNYQSFGDYVCIKKSFLSDLRQLLFELLSNRQEI